jgi:hypothetical protein
MKLVVTAAIGRRREDRFKYVKGTIFLPTVTAKAIWDDEIQGQLSDGAWENVSPQDHYKYWNRLTSVVGTPPRVEANMTFNKSYSLTTLISDLGDRMIGYAKMALVAPELSELGDEMPATFEEFKKAQESSPYNYVKEKLAKVSDDVAQKFYAATYTEKDLRKDLLSIKQAMKNQHWADV